MEAKRIYKGKDDNMLSKISSCLNFFKPHLADFTAYDPHLDASFLAAWEVAHKEVVRFLVSESDEDETVQDSYLIDDSNKVLVKCQTKYKDVKYFAGKAFPDNKEAMKEFGEGAYSKVRNSRLRMVQFMETLYGVAMKYKTELIAQNYTQAAIDEIATLTDELREDNKAQQLKKKERPTETRKRIEALNTFYRFGQTVSEAARAIYPKDNVLRDEFRLAVRHHPKVTKGWFTLGINGIRKTSLTKLLKKFILTLSNQGKETIEYWRAESIHETPLQGSALEAGKNVEINQGVPMRKFLIVKNTSQKEVRMMLTKEAKED